MMVLAVQTFAHHDNGDQAVGARMPAQQWCCQEVNKGSPTCVGCPCKTGRAFGLGALSVFLSRRSLLPAAELARDVTSSSTLRASLANLIDNPGDHFPKRSHRVGAVSPLRQKLFQRKHQLVSSLSAPLDHLKSLSCSGSTDGFNAIGGKEQSRCLIPTKRLPK